MKRLIPLALFVSTVSVAATISPTQTDMCTKLYGTTNCTELIKQHEGTRREFGVNRPDEQGGSHGNPMLQGTQLDVYDDGRGTVWVYAGRATLGAIVLRPGDEVDFGLVGDWDRDGLEDLAIATVGGDVQALLSDDDGR